MLIHEFFFCKKNKWNAPRPTCLGERDELPAPVLLGAFQLVHLVPTVAALKREHNTGPGLGLPGAWALSENDKNLRIMWIILQLRNNLIMKSLKTDKITYRMLISQINHRDMQDRWS